MIDWYVAVLDAWPGERTLERKHDKFGQRARGVDWTGTLNLLERELRHLSAENVVLQGFFDKRRDVRNDGSVRGDANPHHPGVVLTFDIPDVGTIPFSCDTYYDWRANVRAIALSLEALRAVDRYGVTKKGEQYRGFGQLPPAGGSTVTMTTEKAAETMANAAEVTVTAVVLGGAAQLDKFYRSAAKNTHPDRKPDSREFYAVQEAKAVLDAHFGRNGRG